jgi:hypothetical protein
VPRVDGTPLDAGGDPRSEAAVIEVGARHHQRGQGPRAHGLLQVPTPAGHEAARTLEVLAGQPSRKRFGRERRCRIVDIRQQHDWRGVDHEVIVASLILNDMLAAGIATEAQRTRLF